jgi:regulator of sigma E protease
MGALDPEQFGHWLLVILQVAAGLGFVIFVHELGHFAVAKMCGVKCDKFMIGFDVGGYKLSRKWGETEYGIGIVPLGGYVKMLGQDDNPGNVDQQLRESMAGAGVEAKEILGPDGKRYLVDRRSYMAKSVPQRMAIISAGVVMNVIFAVVFATIAYKLGVPYNPSVVSQVAPGSPAWRAGLQPGDEVVEIAGVKNPSFTELKGGVTLGDMEGGVPFVLRRGDETIAKTLLPEQGSGLPRVGITSPMSLRLGEKQPVVEDSAASRATPPLKGGDEIVAIDGEPVAGYADLAAALVRKCDQSVVLQVRRGGASPKGRPFESRSGGELLDVRVEPQPSVTLGLVMPMGPVVAVQENSPAAKAGVKPGDIIERIESLSAQGDSAVLAIDPLLLPEQLRRLAEEDAKVRLTIRRAAGGKSGSTQTTVEAPLLRTDRVDTPVAPNDPVATPALGLAYRVSNVVAAVTAGSPAEKAGLQAGDALLSAKLVYPEGSTAGGKPLKPREIEFSENEVDEAANWPWLTAGLVWQPPGTKIELAYRRGKEERTAAMETAPLVGYYESDRGLNLLPLERIRIAQSWSEALRRGYDETVSSLGMVYRFLGKLGSQIPVTELGGPLTIAQAAGAHAFHGMGALLVFLTMLSANLAVINFLPIPVLDGGHMAFLLWEGIRGKPAGEKFAIAMQTAGLVFILTLMLFVISLDVRRIFFA